MIEEVEPKLKVPLLLRVKGTPDPVEMAQAEFEVPMLQIPLLVKLLLLVKTIVEPPFAVNRGVLPPEVLLVTVQSEKARALPLAEKLPVPVLVKVLAFPVKFIFEEVTVTVPVFVKIPLLTVLLPGKLNVEDEASVRLPGLVLLK